MGYCKKCGKPISSQYLFCYSCNRYAKTYKDESGHARFKDSGTSVHRYVAEEKLGRPLKPWERIHHINRDKTDNTPSNLWVFKNQREHFRAHREDAQNFGTKASFSGFRTKKRKRGFFSIFG